MARRPEVRAKGAAKGERYATDETQPAACCAHLAQLARHRTQRDQRALLVVELGGAPWRAPVAVAAQSTAATGIEEAARAHVAQPLAVEPPARACRRIPRPLGTAARAGAAAADGSGATAASGSAAAAGAAGSAAGAASGGSAANGWPFGNGEGGKLLHVRHGHVCARHPRDATLTAVMHLQQPAGAQRREREPALTDALSTP